VVALLVVCNLQVQSAAAMMAGNLEAAEMQEAAARIPKDVMLSLGQLCCRSARCRPRRRFGRIAIAKGDTRDAIAAAGCAVAAEGKPVTSRPTGYCLRANTWALS
jgi:hypothetical protein